jgi:RNA polymerase sigma-70 factor, ECF subfamily
MSCAHLPVPLLDLLPRLWSFAFRLTGDKRCAEDLIERACLRALERADQLRVETASLSWMFSIVHSTWVSEFRAHNMRKRFKSERDNDLIEDIDDRGDQGLDTPLVHTRIIGAVERLPEPQRVVMLLVAAERMTYEQTAEVLRMPIRTVINLFSRACRTVDALIGQGLVREE